MTNASKISKRFRGFLPIVVDVETAGFNASTNALLEIAMVTIEMTSESQLKIGQVFHEHIIPFAGSVLDPAALEFNKIDPHHPFRFALPEAEALKILFNNIQILVEQHECHRAILVGHNAFFDLDFMRTASARAGIKRFPFHHFTTLDTATLSALAFGQTVLARACLRAKINFDPEQAHSALYDAMKTAELFCHIFNRWQHLTVFERNQGKASP